MQNEEKVEKLEKKIKELTKENKEKDLYIAHLLSEYEHMVNVYSNELNKINSMRFLRLNYYYIKNNGIFRWILECFRTFGKLIKFLFNSVKKKFNKYIYKSSLKKILKKEKYKRIFVFYPGYDWYMKMYQRPQHMAVHFSEEDVLFFYCTVNWNDRVEGFEKIKTNLYVTNQFELLKKFLPKYTLYLYANENGCYIDELKTILKKGNKLLYEYIDDLHEDLTNISDELLERHRFVLNNSKIPVVATAHYLYEKAKKIRGSSENILFSTNGVVYDDFHITSSLPVPTDIKKIVAQNKPIIGYYGALAKWFDYDLVEKIALKHKDWNIILIGIDYDDSFKKHKYFKYLSNVYYLGTKNYKDLIKYGNCCDVLTIPFVINEITLSTSPVKVFEYMSMEKPIVTTDLPECRRYKSVKIGKTPEEFITLLENCIKDKNNQKYKELLRKEALENTWTSKVSEILDFLKESEKRKGK